MSSVKNRSPILSESENAAQLESRIRGVLYAVAYPCLRHVGCIIRGGVLVLNGRLPSYYLKQVAQTVVRPHLGPAMVIDNQISVDRQGGHRTKIRA